MEDINNQINYQKSLMATIDEDMAIQRAILQTKTLDYQKEKAILERLERILLHQQYTIVVRSDNKEVDSALSIYTFKIITTEQYSYRMYSSLDFSGSVWLLTGYSNQGDEILFGFRQRCNFKSLCLIVNNTLYYAQDQFRVKRRPSSSPILLSPKAKGLHLQIIKELRLYITDEGFDIKASNTVVNTLTILK